jgi:hypothetical protein
MSSSLCKRSRSARARVSVASGQFLTDSRATFCTRAAAAATTAATADPLAGAGAADAIFDSR